MTIAGRSPRFGYSRIEISLAVFVVLIVSSLLVISICRMQTVREGGHYQVTNNLRQVALACHVFHDHFKKLPPAFDKHEVQFAASVHVHLLPYVEKEDLFKELLIIGNDRPLDSEIVPAFLESLNRKSTPVGDAPERPFPVSFDPSQDDDRGIQNYAANLRVFADKGVKTSWDANMPALAKIEPGTSGLFRTFTDGTSNTIVFATKLGRCGEGGSRITAAPNSPSAAFFGQNAATVHAQPGHSGAVFQLAPSPVECRTSPLMAQSFKDTGLDVAMGDGSFRRVSPKISPRTWNLLLQPNDGKTIDENWDN